jgi:hypothetical protein
VLFYRVLRAHSGQAVRRASRHNANCSAPPIRSAPLQRLPAHSSGISNKAYLTSSTYVLRFSRPRDASIRHVPAGLVSCQIRSWGCTLQSFFLPRSRTPSPAPIPSGRWKTSTHPRYVARRNVRQATASSRIPRLQGFAPRESPPLLSRRIRSARSAWLSWAFYPPGCSPYMRRHGFHRISPHELRFVHTRTHTFNGSTGSRPQADWLVSEKTAYPPGLHCLLILTNVKFDRGSGVASSGIGVRHRPLTYHL